MDPIWKKRVLAVYRVTGIEINNLEEITLKKHYWFLTGSMYSTSMYLRILKLDSACGPSDAGGVHPSSVGKRSITRTINSQPGCYSALLPLLTLALGETFALLHCPPWEMHQALGMSQLDGKRGEHLEREQELTFTEHLLSPQELSRPPHSQALLSCPYWRVSWGPKCFPRYITV